MESDLSKFTRTIVLVADALAPVSDYIQTDVGDLRPDGEMLIDEFCITEDGLEDGANDPGTSYCHLGLLLARWWMSGEGLKQSAAYNLFDWQSYYSKTPKDTFTQTGDAVILRRKLFAPITLKADEKFSCDWENPMITPVKTIDGFVFTLVAIGYGVETGLRRMMSLEITTTTSTGGGAAGTSGTTAPSTASTNGWGEDVVITHLGIRIMYQAAITDWRVLQRIRIRPIFGHKSMALCKDDGALIPIGCFGDEEAAASKKVIGIRPAGGPLLVTPSKSPVWEFKNSSAGTVSRVIVAAWGRIPG